MLVYGHIVFNIFIRLITYYIIIYYEEATIPQNDWNFSLAIHL